jgi:alpha-glucosidase
MRREGPLSPDWIRANQVSRLAALAQVSPQAWPCNTLGNHDCSRVYTRFGDGVHDAERARLGLALMLTLKGTPFLYNGEEIGMTDYLLTDPGQLRDTMATWYHQRLLNELGVHSAEAATRAGKMSRDKNRTPMQWSNAVQAGFCTVDPWLPVNPNFAEGINVKDQHVDPNSLLNFYKRMLHLRKSTPALIEGEYAPLHENAAGYLAFLRRSQNQTVLVVLSFSSKRELLSFPEFPASTLHTLFSSAGRSKFEENLEELHLGAFEVYIGELK